MDANCKLKCCMKNQIKFDRNQSEKGQPLETGGGMVG